jgi:glucose-6-phosphate dehydrogenase assembly protein OpcA
MRMYGRLALHAESVTLPLLAPDAPVVTWWVGSPPDRIAYDPLGVFADRRITDVSRSPDRVAALRQRAADFAPGDTDLAWTRVTGWRAALASAYDGAHDTAVAATVSGDDSDPSALLLAGWLSSRLGCYVPVTKDGSKPIESVTMTFGGGVEITAVHEGTRLVVKRTGTPDSIAPFPDRSVGELLAEELRRLEADEVYAEALGTVTGQTGLSDRPGERVHIWNDPATAAS